MVEMREQFEKLPEIAAHLKHGNVFFYEENQTYASEFQDLHMVACYVNGAWYAFQEQQKKIDGALKELELLNYYRTGNSDNAIKILKGTEE